jgi:hypothetical protein
VKPRRFRFTLRQLMVFIGFMAAICFFLTTTSWWIGLAIAIVTPGFILDRRQGGAGILGAMLAGALGFIAIGVALYAYSSFNGDASALGHTGPGAWLTGLGLGGLFCGTIFGLCTWSVLFLLGLLNRLKPPHAESRGSAFRHGRGDGGLEHPGTGRPLP